MYFALGLLTAGLIAFLVAPAIWRRAMRLTRARIEATLPMTRGEIAAGKDHLRARFAVANRRLEIDAERLNDKLARERIGVASKRNEIAALGREKAALAETIDGLETRISELGGALAANEEKLTSANAEVARRDQIIAERAAELATAQAKLGLGQQMSEEQRVELVARETNIGNLEDRIAALTAAEAAAVAARDKLDADLAAERKRAGGLEAGLAAMRAERAERLSELERRAEEVKRLESEIAATRQERQAAAGEIAALTADRDRLRAELDRRGEEAVALDAKLSANVRRQEELEKVLAGAEATLEAAQSQIASLGGEPIAEGDNLRKAIAATEAEKEALAARLAALEQEHAALRAENAELRRMAGPEWESQRRENQALRDRLNEIAANVVQLTKTAANPSAASSPAGTGNGTPPEPQPAPEHPPAQSGATPDTDEQPRQASRGLSLAERLRALQHAGAGR